MKRVLIGYWKVEEGDGYPQQPMMRSLRKFALSVVAEVLTNKYYT